MSCGATGGLTMLCFLRCAVHEGRRVEAGGAAGRRARALCRHEGRPGACACWLWPGFVLKRVGDAAHLLLQTMPQMEDLT